MVLMHLANLLYLQMSWSELLRTRFYNMRRKSKLLAIGLEVSDSKPSECITTFNSDAHICMDYIKFKGTTRHARFVDVFASFMHVLELCKEESINSTLDNLLTVALGSRPVAIILISMLGSSTFEHLIHLNRDIGDATKVLAEISTTSDIDEYFP